MFWAQAQATLPRARCAVVPAHWARTPRRRRADPPPAAAAAARRRKQSRSAKRAVGAPKKLRKKKKQSVVFLCFFFMMWIGVLNCLRFLTFWKKGNCSFCLVLSSLNRWKNGWNLGFLISHLPGEIRHQVDWQLPCNTKASHSRTVPQRKLVFANANGNSS